MRARDIEVGESYHYGHPKDYAKATILSKLGSIGMGWQLRLPDGRKTKRSTTYYAVDAEYRDGWGRINRLLTFMPSSEINTPWDEWLVGHLEREHEEALRVAGTHEGEQLLRFMAREVKNAFDEEEWGYYRHQSRVSVPTEWAYDQLEDES